MSTVTFDTLKFVKELENAGMPQQQAEAQAKALANALSESLDTTLATKADMLDVRPDAQYPTLSRRFPFNKAACSCVQR